MVFGPIEARDDHPIAKQDENTIYLQLERFDRAMRAQIGWAKTAKKAVDYVEGRQWTDTQRSEREAEGRPTLTINKIRPLYKLISGHQRQNRSEIKYLPGNTGSGSAEIAETLTHVSKHLDERNLTRWNDADMFGDGMITGRAYLDQRLDFRKNLLGEIREAVLDPFSVYPDPDAQTYDPEGWSFVYKSMWLSVDDIRTMYGKKNADMVQAIDPHNRIGISALSNISEGVWEDDITPERFFAAEEWFDSENQQVRWGRGILSSSIMDHLDTTQKLVRVLESQHHKMVMQKFFVDPVTGSKREIPDFWKRDRIVRVVEWAQAQGHEVLVQELLDKRVRWTVTALDKVLYDEWSPYRSFTIRPYFSWFRRGKTMGMIEDLMDPQDEINKRRSAYIEIVGRMANSGWMYEANSMDPQEEENLINYGAQPGVHVKYKSGKQPPEQIQPPMPPLAFERLEAQASTDLKDISNINDAALGQEEKVQSGRAILAKQQQTVIAYEPEFDNFARFKHMQGTKRLELIQDFYTEQRIIAVRGADDENEEMTINQLQTSGEIINDVTSGSYSTDIDDVPMSASFLSAQLDEAFKFVELGILIPPDTLIDLSSLPNKKQLKKRLMEAEQAGGEKEDAVLEAEIGKMGAEVTQLEAEAVENQASAEKSMADAEATRVKVPFQTAVMESEVVENLRPPPAPANERPKPRLVSNNG